MGSSSFRMMRSLLASLASPCSARRLKQNSARPTPCYFRAVHTAAVHRQLLYSQDAKLACLARFPPLRAPAETKSCAPHTVLFQGGAQSRGPSAGPRCTGSKPCLPRSLPPTRRAGYDKILRSPRRDISGRCTEPWSIGSSAIHRMRSLLASLASLRSASRLRQFCTPHAVLFQGSAQSRGPSAAPRFTGCKACLLAWLASPPLGAPAETKFCAPHAVLCQGGAQSRGPYAAPRFKGCKACLPRSLPSARRAA